MTITLDFCRLPDPNQPPFDYLLLFSRTESKVRLLINFTTVFFLNSTALMIEPVINFITFSVLFVNHFNFGFIFLWCLANKDELIR